MGLVSVRTNPAKRDFAEPLARIKSRRRRARRAGVTRRRCARATLRLFPRWCRLGEDPQQLAEALKVLLRFLRLLYRTPRDVCHLQPPLQPNWTLW